MEIRHVNIAVTDADYQTLMHLKGQLSWKEYLCRELKGDVK